MIKLENVTKTIGKKVILENLSLKINQGDLVAIVGKSGSGKSTLLNLLGLIDGDYSGHYEIFGQQNVPVNSVKSQAIIREHISYLFQNFALIENKTVYQNLSLIKKSARADITIAEALKTVGLEDKLNQKIFSLSGGEQQRVALARLMLKKCELILADEPTGALDRENSDIVLSILKKYQQLGKTICLVTHDEYVKTFCDRRIDL